MMKIVKHKLYFLLSNRFATISCVFIFLTFNFQAIFNSGILLSGGSDFNATLKYALLINNYLLVASVLGFLLCIFLGANIIGPDLYTGNLYILLSICESRVTYYLYTFLAVFLYMLFVQVLLVINVILLFLAFGLSFLWSDLLYCFFSTMLNSVVALAITGLASIYIQGYGSAFVGLFGFAYYNAYTFNELPFINVPLSFNFAQYKDYAAYLLPITNTLVPSITDPAAYSIYSINTVFPSIELYQVIYIVFILAISLRCFQARDL